jgi:hypothetical protein
MPSRRIFDSNVWHGIPGFAAAPEGPDIRAWHLRETAAAEDWLDEYEQVDSPIPSPTSESCKNTRSGQLHCPGA